MNYTVYYESPIGILKIIAMKEEIISLTFLDEEVIPKKAGEICPLIMETVKQLDEYFGGSRKSFHLPIQIYGTEFQKNVLKEVMNIPYGEKKSYKDIAVSIKKEKAFRAVGNANNKNKLLILIPCHRVIGTNGKLAGYAGGLWRKEWLLNHEKKAD